MELQIPTVTIDDLRAFHAKHFPQAPLPEHYLHGSSHEDAEEYYEEEDDGLGYYPDGTKRTLTDEQIAMFRHSEIQAILRKRRLIREGGYISEEGETISEAAQTVKNPTQAPASASVSTAPETCAPKPPKQQWATSSARTKARNKRHRDNYRMKKKEMRERKGRAQTDDHRVRDDDEESDEWDPWHQANGPDAQKDDALDLDY